MPLRIYGENMKSVGSNRNRVFRFGVRVLLVIPALLLVLILLEGLAGLARATLVFVRARPFAEQYSTEFDPILGWKGRANFKKTDFYGPGRSIESNSQRFRNSHEIAKEPPAGRVRVVCSGDSFTLGYGVDNEATWCAQLENLDPQIEAVNLGQGGYGIDQSYLWAGQALRDIRTDVHILAFICDDFDRMRVPTLNGFGKPMLSLDGKELVATNQPVPQTLPLAPTISQAVFALAQLNLVQLVRHMNGGNSESGTFIDVPTLMKIVETVFSELAERQARQGGQFVLVKLPIPGERRDSCHWWNEVSEMADKHGWPVVDVLNTGWPGSGMDRGLYLTDDEVEFEGAGGHLNEKGNELVARIVLTKLMTIPSVNEKLAKARVSPSEQ